MKKVKQPPFILLANLDTSALSPEILQKPDIKNMVERTEDDWSKLPEVRSKLRKVLDQIIDNEGNLPDSEELQYFLRVANELVTEYRVEQGKLIKGLKAGTHWPLCPKWKRDLSVHFCRYLSTQNLSKIKNCGLCENYFIASKADKRIKFCPLCRRKERRPKKERTRLVAQWRHKKRKDRSKREREERIQRLLASGFSREEAEAEVDVYILADQEI